MKIGKIPMEVLEQIVLEPIQKNKNKRNDIVVRPKTGEDCAAMDPGCELCIVSTDPITGADNNAGYLAVHINCNDIAASGGEPVGILLTVLLPQESTQSVLEEIMQGAYEAASEAGIEILGGHTEVTAAVNKPVISAAVIGKTVNRNFISSGGACPGQDIIMTKWAGLEGTVILATDFHQKLSALVGSEVIENAKKMQGFLSVIAEARIGLQYGATAMHDVTEGGIFGAVWEVLHCSGCSGVLYQDAIAIKEETAQLCSALAINPYRLIASGCLIMTAFDGEKIVQALQREGIEAARIGKITELEKEGQVQAIVQTADGNFPLEQPSSDELYIAIAKMK